MPPPPIAHDPAATPVVVVLGGPSAEHDVSIVSGSAIRDALAASGYPTETWLIDLGGGWWRLPVSDGASLMDRVLAGAGRDPYWSPES